MTKSKSTTESPVAVPSTFVINSINSAQFRNVASAGKLRPIIVMSHFTRM